MIKVVFKEKYGKFGEQEFTYKNFPKIEVGDEVLVNTRYGLALAMVTQIDVEDDRFDEDNLAEVVQIVDSAKDKEDRKKAIAAKERIMKAIVENAKREKLLTALRDMINPKDFEDYVAGMTIAELEELYYEMTI